MPDQPFVRANSLRPPGARLASRRILSVYQPGLDSSFRASIRGHILNLADPDSRHELAPTPEDLFVAALASQVAWSARSFLHAHGRPEDVSVSANWRADGNVPGRGDLELAVTVSRDADDLGAALVEALELSLGEGSFVPAVRISLQGAGG